MASLTGNQIKDTYEGLLKTTDNDVLGSSAKVITDGAGNASGLSLDTNGNVAVAADLSVGDELIVTGAASVGGTLTLDGALIDSNGSSGTGGQVLASTVTGTDWVSLSEISGVDGTGTADKIAKWSDTDSIANSTITDNGSLVSFATPISVTGAATSTGANTASSFVKTGGTSSQFLKADGSVDGTVYATEADLTTAEGRISVNEGDIVAIEAKTDYITVTQAVNLDTMESDIAGVKTKTDYITVTQAVDLDDMESDIATNTSDISTNASAITTKVSKSGDTMTGNLTSTGFIKTGGTSTQFLKADGSVDSSTYLTAESDTLDAVTDRGATTTNSIAVGNVTATSFIKSGGTSAQFLKADGSIDSNAYITAESDTLDSVTDRGAVTTNTVTVGDFNAQASSLNSLSVVTTSSFTGDAAFDTDTLFVDVSADRVGVNTNAPTEALDVVGNIKASGTLAVTGNLTVDTNTLFVDAANNRVGVGTASPASKIESYVVNTGAIGASNSANIALGSDGALDTRSIMTFGKQINGGYAPAYLGYITTDGAGTSKGDIFLGTRSLTTDSPPAERMRIKSDGDISFRDSSANEAFYWDASAASLGIGTLIPSDKLSVYTTTDYGNNSTYANATIGLGNQTYPVSIRSYRYGGSYLNGLDFYYNNGTPQLGMRIDASGNVGIGISPSQGKLHLYNSGSAANLYIESDASNNAVTSQISLGGASGRAALIQGYREGSSNLHALIFRTYDSGSYERMRIDSSGNVGIGTDSIFNPGGSVQKSLELSGSSYSTIYLSANSAAVRGQFGADNVNGLVEIGARTNHPFRILTNNSERMRIDASGNVGIGTASITGGSKLHVFSTNGTAYSSNAQLRISSGVGNNRAAIVFSDDALSDAKISYAPSAAPAGQLFSFSARSTATDFVLTGDGYARLGSTMGGIQFGGDSAAANALDDYEEGTFTPTLTASTSNPTVTYDATSTSGRYTKIGNQVTISFEVRWTALSGGSGDVRISNLPFTAFNGNPDGSRMILESYNNTISGLYLTGSVYKNTNYIDIVNNVSGAPFISFTVGGLNTGFGLLRGTVTYFVS